MTPPLPLVVAVADRLRLHMGRRSLAQGMSGGLWWTARWSQADGVLCCTWQHPVTLQGGARRWRLDELPDEHRAVLEPATTAEGLLAGRGAL